MPRLRRGFQPRSRSVRVTSWGFGPNAVNTAISASSSVLWTNGVTLVAEAKATIVRARGEIALFLTAATSAADGFTGAVGLCMVTNEAFAAGAGSIPGPQSDIDWDGWMWHSVFHLFSPLVALAPSAGDMLGSVRIPIDSKAMRIQEDNETLVGVVEVTELGAAALEFAADSRLLYKLS